MIGYWFSRADGTTKRLTTPAEVGRTDSLPDEQEVVPCVSGYHASPTPWDALQRAPGAMMWEVELGGEIVEHGSDKYAAQTRKYLRCADLTAVCRWLVAKHALSVIDHWGAPAVVREYLTDEAAGQDRSDIRPAVLAAAFQAWHVSACEPCYPWAAALAAREVMDGGEGAAVARDAACEKYKEQFNRKAIAELERGVRYGG